MIFLKLGQRIYELVFPAVIKRNYNRLVRKFAFPFEIIDEIGKGNNVVSILLKIFHLLIEYFRSYGQPPFGTRAEGDPLPDVMVHQDRNFYCEWLAERGRPALRSCFRRSRPLNAFESPRDRLAGRGEAMLEQKGEQHERPRVTRPPPPAE